MNSWLALVVIVIFVSTQLFLYKIVKKEFGQKGLIIGILFISVIIAVLLAFPFDNYYLLRFVVLEFALFSIFYFLKIRNIKEKKFDKEIEKTNDAIKKTLKINRPSATQLELIYSFFLKHEILDEDYDLMQFSKSFLVAKMRLNMDVPSLRYFYDSYTKSIGSTKVGVFRNFFINAKTGDVYDEKQFSNNLKNLPILHSEIDELMNKLMGIHSK